MKNKGFQLVLAASLFCCTTRIYAQGRTYSIPLGGNAYSNKGTDTRGGRVDNGGIAGWTDSSVFFTVYFRVQHPGAIHLRLRMAVPEGKSRIRVSMPGTGMAGGALLEAEGAGVKVYDAGSRSIADTGYQSIRIAGIARTGKYFADISFIDIEEPGASIGLGYVPNNEGNFFHWGRRGPSVHLNYPLPEHTNVEWFYNEVTVPVGNDLQGSYFMADGFGQGYFGMQVNSPTERHILFSVWSPFQTDNPRAIPDSQRILLVKKGEGVHAGEFGNEGSGGQSWLNFPWKAGNTYRFLLRARPVEHGYTQFTAWFYAPEEGKWKLIASFSRPQTQVWLTNFHSFLENFEPEQGDKHREVQFAHQWIRDEHGVWTALHRARFTGDNTARKGYRMDYSGGARGNAFYLANCGFFNEYTPINSWWETKEDAAAAGSPGASVTGPAVDLDRLP